MYLLKLNKVRWVIDFSHVVRPCQTCGNPIPVFMMVVGWHFRPFWLSVIQEELAVPWRFGMFFVIKSLPQSDNFQWDMVGLHISSYIYTCVIRIHTTKSRDIQLTMFRNSISHRVAWGNLQRPPMLPECLNAWWENRATNGSMIPGAT